MTFFSDFFPSGCSDVRKGLGESEEKGQKSEVTGAVIIPLRDRHSR